MAKIDYSALAAAIMENVGGSGNVHTVSHCVTRLRFCTQGPLNGEGC